MEQNKINHVYEKDETGLYKIVESKDKYGVIRRYKYNQSDYMKKYHQKHHDDLRERTECVCGKSYSRWNQSHHLTSKYHLKRVDNLINILP